MKEISRFLIGAPSSGSGKTTVTLGLLRALKNRGKRVQPFKCGPDYIDTKYHDMSSGNKSINLDLFLSSESHIKDLYSKYSNLSDICIAEGVMGLFDGYKKMSGSSAEVAEKLDLPIVLVVNAKSVAYSVAPLLYGFKNFSDKINLIGVIFNFVASESHYSFLKDACEDAGIESFGYLPKNANIEIPSRHLGLTLDEKYQFDEFADRAATLVEQHIDIDRLLASTLKKIEELSEKKEKAASTLKISVALDEAFNFVYHENIEYLKSIGEVTFFSPIRDKELPKSDFIYFPGGYPELYLKELSKNTSLHTAIREYVENGGKVWAECGGMMYLSTCIVDNEGQEFPMVGVFEQKASMENMKLKLGYRYFTYNGLDIKGHEFHYSHTDSDLTSITQQYNARNSKVDTKLLRHKNVIAGYTHIYWAEAGNILDLY